MSNDSHKPKRVYVSASSVEKSSVSATPVVRDVAPASAQLTIHSLFSASPIVAKIRAMDNNGIAWTVNSLEETIKSIEAYYFNTNQYYVDFDELTAETIQLVDNSIIPSTYDTNHMLRLDSPSFSAIFTVISVIVALLAIIQTELHHRADSMDAERHHQEQLQWEKRRVSELEKQTIEAQKQTELLQQIAMNSSKKPSVPERE